MTARKRHYTNYEKVMRWIKSQTKKLRKAKNAKRK